MLRQIIKIDEELCNGCGLCAAACHEGAIGMIGGKAKLLRDDYCDGLGDCLPVCPTGAITFEQRDTLAYNEEEVKRNMEQKAAMQQAHAHHHHHGGGCPGSMARAIERTARVTPQPVAAAAPSDSVSELNQWPVQIKLVPVNAPYFDNANLLIAADCTAYSYANFHSKFMKNKVTLIGCPKLDEGDYAEKLTAIIANNNIKHVTVIRMEVPCCGGIENAVKTALRNSGKMLPWRVVTITTDGQALED